jgi:hypothetical protein
MSGTLDVLVVSIGGTTGWRGSARGLSDGFAAAGARAHAVITGPTPPVRTFALTDLVQARWVQAATERAIAERRPRAIVYCSMTAALLWPRPGAIWLDSLAAENRPGRHGMWQRPVERRRLSQASVIMTMAEGALNPVGGPAAFDPVVVPVAIAPSGEPAARRDIEVLAYAGDPVKRRLELVLDAWARARRPGETLVVAGVEDSRRIEGVRFAGRLSPTDYRRLVRRAQVFAAAPLREDFGIAPLEALADGCRLVTTPSPGPYPALGLARQLDPRLVCDDLAPALRAALDDPRPDYAGRAHALLQPFTPAAVQRTLAERVLPRLVPGWGP